MKNNNNNKSIFNNNILSILLIITCLNIHLSQSVAPTWTQFAPFRIGISISHHIHFLIGQSALFQDPFFPLNQNKTTTITYTSPLPSTSHYVLFISGFQNFLTTQIHTQIFLNDLQIDKIIIDTFFGQQTYMKRLNINYFVCDNTFTTKIQTSIAKYRTYLLINSTGLRPQSFQNITLTQSSTQINHYISAISGIQLYNPTGTINYMNIQTQILLNPINKIKHTIITDQENKIYEVKISTIVFYKYTGYPNDLTEFSFKRMINPLSNATNGFMMLNMIGNKGFFAIQDNLLFGIRGFNFSMKQSRLFLLNTLPQPDWTINLFTNPAMQNINLTLYLVGQFTCASGSFYHYDKFDCINPCTDLYTDPITSICYTCLSTCKSCTNNINNCQTCYPNQNRILNTGNNPKTCDCDQNNGYVNVGKDICEKCEVRISGCVKCTIKQSCDLCQPTKFIRIPNSTHPSYKTCICPNNEYLVSGICLPYPGCIQANTITTGKQCLNCSSSKNFKPTPNLLKQCDCKFGYYYNSFNDMCEDNCGNGQTADGIGKCDDGNMISGDGCSDKCYVQFGYTCTQPPGNPHGLSTCGLQQTISINYLYVQKTLYLNQAILVFSLHPKLFLLPQSFQNNHITSIPFISKSIKYNPITSLIYLTIDYNENIQNLDFHVKFSFNGLSVHGDDIDIKGKLNGLNARLVVGENVLMSRIVVYVAMVAGAIALLLSIISSLLGQKLIGFQLILPIQASFFIISTFPSQIISPISALYSLKYSSGYNILSQFLYQSTYTLHSKLIFMNYSSQFIQNYNLMYCLLFIILIIFAVCGIRIVLLENKQEDIQSQLKQLQEKKLQDQHKKNVKNVKQQQQQDTGDNSNKKLMPNINKLSEQLQNTKDSIHNWKSFMYTIFDKIFSTLIVTSMQNIFFCFFIQFTNLIPIPPIYSITLNSFFCFLTFITIIIGLYSILYDYKSDKLITFHSNKGKYAIFYILNFLVYITILGSIYQTSLSIFIIGIFSIIPFILIIYQKPYGVNRLLSLQVIITLICQIPFLIMVILSSIINIINPEDINENVCLIFVYLLLGSVGINILLTIFRLVKVIDMKKLTFFQFSDRKNNKKNKNNKTNVKLLQLGKQQNWDELSVDSVRQMIFQRQNINNLKQNQQEKDNFQNQQEKQKILLSILEQNQKRNNDQERKRKISENSEDIIEQLKQQQDDDQEIGQLEKIKIKLRKQIKQKKIMGKNK